MLQDVQDNFGRELLHNGRCLAIEFTDVDKRTKRDGMGKEEESLPSQSATIPIIKMSALSRDS